MKPNEIAELLRFATPEEQEEINRLLDDGIWRPLPGPQFDAYHSTADVTGYGGAAGGGKTDLMCGTLLTQHRRGIILRQIGTELTAIEDRLEELLGSRDGYNSQKMIWRTRRFDKVPVQIEFGSLPNDGDEKKYQGRPHDFIGFDEAANMREAQVRFLLGWLRTTTPGQRCRAILTFNPPTSAEGRWIISFFGPWLDDKHPNPAQPGEIRWFASLDGKDVEVESGAPFEHAGETIQPLSRTFIPSRIADNPYLMATGYMATLQSLPEPLRSQMLKGDFMAGVQDDPWQVIPTAWIDAAQKRWKLKDAKGPMDSLGVDVARGGRDKTVISRRHGTWFDVLLALPGSETPDGPTTASYVIASRRDHAPAHVDVIGWGSSAFDFLIENGIQAEPINGAEGTTERTEDEAGLGFVNKRALMWWRMREALNPENPAPIALPPDTELKADLSAPRWKLRTNGIQIESKDDIQKRIGRSPDRGDAVCMALFATPKTGGKVTKLKVPNYGQV